MGIKICLKILVSLSAIIFTANLYAIPVAGESSGIFVNPTGPSTMQVTGVGTDYFTWGNGSPYNSPPSSLGYAGNLFSVETDDVFSFGTLSYFNGTVYPGTEAYSVDLSVALSLTIPSGITQDFLYDLALINTPNTGDPNASADIVNFAGTQPDTFFTVDGVNYTLEFLGFGEITGPGFTTIDNFHVLEGRSASAQLLGRITVASVPEPTSLVLTGLGLAGLGFSRRKKAA